jgi:hypothetical protein
MVARQTLLLQPQNNHLEASKISQSRKLTIINKNPEICWGSTDIQQFISNHHSLKNHSKATKSILENSEDKTLLLIEKNRNRYIHIAGVQSYAG